MFSLVVDVDGHPDCSSSMTRVCLFSNTVIHLYTLCCSKALFPYCAGSLWWISAPGIACPQKSYHCTLLFFGAYRKQCSRVNSVTMILHCMLLFFGAYGKQCSHVNSATMIPHCTLLFFGAYKKWCSHVNSACYDDTTTGWSKLKVFHNHRGSSYFCLYAK
jgi:hypothetical protein